MLQAADASEEEDVKAKEKDEAKKEKNKKKKTTGMQQGVCFHLQKED